MEKRAGRKENGERSRKNTKGGGKHLRDLDVCVCVYVLSSPPLGF